MEEPYKSRVLNSIFNLSQITDCSAALLIYLQQEGTLIQQDIGVINSISIPIQKTHKLYEILLRCPGSYQPLISGLRETNQLGAVEILETSTPPRQRKRSPSPYYDEIPSSTSEMSQCPPYPVHNKFVMTDTFVSDIEQDSPIYMPMPKFDFTCPPPSPAVPKGGDIERCPSLGNLNAQLQQLTTDPNIQLETLHKYLLRSHSNGKPLILIESTSTPEDLRQHVQKYADEYHHHFDHNVVWIDAKNRSTLEETFLHSMKHFRLETGFSPNVGFDVNCCGTHGGEVDLKAMSNQLYKHFLGGKCIFIFENVDKDDPLLSTVLPPTPFPSGYPPILMISTGSGKEDWGDTNVAELTKEGKVVRKSPYLKKIMGPIFQTVLETFNKAKTEYYSYEKESYPTLKIRKTSA